MKARPAPSNKADFYARYQAGEFGNRMRIWPCTCDLLMETRPPRTVNLRSKKIAGNFIPGVSITDAINLLATGSFVANENPPDDCLLIQGEVGRTVEGLYLWYSTVPGLRMRDAMKQGIEAKGLVADAILGHYLAYRDYELVMSLVDAYDGVVEFSAYSVPVGIDPGYQVAIWEVRAY